MSTDPNQNERLQHLQLKLKRRQFGTKSERLPEEQLLFAFEEIEATLAGNAAEAGKVSPTLRDSQAKRRRTGRGWLPAHLPRVEVVLAPEVTSCPCCAGPLVEIGTDTAERLDVIPAQFRVVVNKRPKLACWSHVRREFIDLGKTAPIAQETLKRIAALYAVEMELCGKPPDLRQVGRQEQSRPLVETLFA